MLLYLFLSCLVSSFNSTIHQAQVPLQIYRCVQFKSVLFYSSRSSMLVVINKITEAWPSTVHHGERSQLLFALHQSPIDSQIFVENRDLCLPTCTRRNRWRGPRRKIAIRFGTQKLEWWKKSEDMNTRFDRIRECDRQTPHDGTGCGYT